MTYFTKVALNMAGESTEILSTRFDSDKLPDSLQWFCEPTKWQSRASNGEGLTVFVVRKVDLVKKTIILISVFSFEAVN